MILSFTFKSLIQLIVIIKKCKTITLFSIFNHYQYVFQYTYIKDNKHGSPISSPLFLYWYVHYFNRPCNHLRTDIQYNPDLTPPFILSWVYTILLAPVYIYGLTYRAVPPSSPIYWPVCKLFYWPLSSSRGWHTGRSPLSLSDSHPPCSQRRTPGCHLLHSASAS